MRHLAVAAAVLFLSVSGRSSAPKMAARPGSVTIVRRLEEPVRTFNPIAFHALSERYVAQYLFTPLLYLNENMQPVAGLARYWSVSDSGRIYQFELNPRATFSDGTPVRAQDVLFSLRKLSEPGVAHSGSEFEYLDLARTRTTSPTTIEVAFTRALALQLRHFADAFIVPEHVYGRGDFKNDFKDVAVGSGPYVLAEHDDAHIVLRRRTRDWRDDAPPADVVLFRTITDWDVSWRALKLGQIDESYVPTMAWQHERTDPNLQRKITFRRFYLPEYSCVAWNLRRPLLKDVRVRRALAMSVPTDQIVATIFAGAARSFAGPFSPDHEGSNPEVPRPRYDPAAASRLLVEAGWRRRADGVLERNRVPLHLTLLIPSASAREFAQVVQAKLRDIGVEVEIDLRDLASERGAIERGDYDAAYVAWTPEPDADLYSMFHSSQCEPRGRNAACYQNDAVDRLLSQAREEADTGRRRELYRRAHALIAADEPYSYYIQVAAKWGTSSRLRDVRVSPKRGLFLWYPGELAWTAAPNARETIP